MSSTRKIPEERFKANLLDLIITLKDIIENANSQGFNGITPIMMTLLHTYLEGVESVKIIDSFIKNSYRPDQKNTTQWDHIHTCNDNYFTESMNTLFGHIKIQGFDTTTYLLYIKEVYQKYTSIEDKKYIWNVLNSFVKISIHYIHEGREPVIQIGTGSNGTDRKGYKNKTGLHKDVDIKKYSILYQVELVFSKRIE